MISINQVERVTTTDAEPAVVAAIPVPVGGMVVVSATVTGKDGTGCLRFHVARAVNSARRHGSAPPTLSGRTGTVVGQRVATDLPRPEFFFAISGNDLALKVAGKVGMTIEWEVGYEAVVADGRRSEDARGEVAPPLGNHAKPPEVGALVLHSAGPCGRVARVWEPGTYLPPGNVELAVSCAVVELSTGDALCHDERRAGDFTVVPEALASAYELLLLPRSRVFVETARRFAAKLAAESGAEVDSALLDRLLAASLREALRRGRGEVPK